MAFLQEVKPDLLLRLPRAIGSGQGDRERAGPAARRGQGWGGARRRSLPRVQVEEGTGDAEEGVPSSQTRSRRSPAG